MQGSSKLTSMTETSREALVVFAENVDSVNNSIKNLNDAINKQGDLLAVNKKLVSTMKQVENKISNANELTIGELKTIANSLVTELNGYSQKSEENNKKLTNTLTNFSISSGTALTKAMKKVNQNPIYNRIIANQTLHSQQILNLIKQNNSLVGKMKEKSAMIKYP
jgi:hypothetical protein